MTLKKSENNFQISPKRNLLPQCTTSPPKKNADHSRQATIWIIYLFNMKVLC
jgi:hypothetical protein